MFIPYARQSINEADVQAVVNVLRSDFLTQGPTIPLFEEAVANYCGVQFAVAVNSATSALHIACLALDVGHGDIVWTSPISFVASANCALYCGAQVDFVDVNPTTFNMDVKALAEKLAVAKSTNSLPKVVIPVHLAGQSCDMESIYLLSQQYGFRIIEDASHAIGGTYYDRPIGGCSFSDITVFSFHPVKIITSGEGGMATTNSRGLAAKMERLRSHGITRNNNEFVGSPDGPWYYEQLDIGFNFRMTDVAAALGLSQFQRIDEFVKRRNEIAQEYDRLFSGSIAIPPTVATNNRSAFHLYVLRFPFGAEQKKQFFEIIRNSDIGLNVHYIPIYRQPHYAQFGYKCNTFPNAENYYREAVSIPMFVDLSPADQGCIAEKMLSAATTIFEQ